MYHISTHWLSAVNCRLRTLQGIMVCEPFDPVRPFVPSRSHHSRPSTRRQFRDCLRAVLSRLLHPLSLPTRKTSHASCCHPLFRSPSSVDREESSRILPAV